MTHVRMVTNKLRAAITIQRLGWPGRKNTVTLAFQQSISAVWCQRRSRGMHKARSTTPTRPILKYSVGVANKYPTSKASGIQIPKTISDFGKKLALLVIEHAKVQNQFGFSAGALRHKAESCKN